MKMIKQAALVAGIFAAGLVSAQSADMRNMLKVGVSGGLAVPKNNASAAAGLDVAYQNLVVPGVGLGIATGYTQYFGRDNNGVKNNDFGVVPVAALIRIYPKQTGFYFGTDLGYGIITGNKYVAEGTAVERPNGGFYIKPELGYHNQNWNFAVQYQKTFTGSKGDLPGQDFSAGSLGVGVGYNIPLGK